MSLNIAPRILRSIITDVIPSNPRRDTIYWVNGVPHMGGLNNLPGPSTLAIRPSGAVEEGSTGYTFGATVLVKPKFWAVKLHLMNASATASTGVKASIGVVPDIATPFVPSAISSFSFSGAGTVTMPAAISGGGTTNVVVSDTVSDLLPLSSADLSSMPGFRAVHYRVWQPTGSASRCISLANGQANISTIGNCGGYVNSDVISSVPGFASAVTDSDLGPPAWLELIGGGQTLLGCGDSTVHGLGSTPNGYGAGAIAVRTAQLLGKNVVWYNQGHSGQTSKTYLVNGLNLLNTIKPLMAAFAPASPNDTIANGMAADKYTQAGIDNQAAQAVAWVQACRKIGTSPILLTSTPENGLTSTQEGFRRAHVQQIKDICSTMGVRMIDRDSIYTDYSTNTGGFKAGLFNTGSPLHPNLAGYTLEAALWVNHLNSVYA